MPSILNDITAFVFGTVIGSFANVCIYRLPREFSISKPRSRCIRCGCVLSWYENIPILSILGLKARCKHCGSPYSFSHFWVEVLVGMVALWLWKKNGATFLNFYLFSLFTSLLIVSLIDLEFRIIPDEISLNGIWIGILLAGLASGLGKSWPISLQDSLLGAFFGGGLLWGVGKLYEGWTGREGIGFGDVKLLAMFGANGGVEGVVVSLFYASLFGSGMGILGLLLGRMKRLTPIPFGPFLCLGLLIFALGGGRWIFNFCGF